MLAGCASPAPETPTPPPAAAAPAPPASILWQGGLPAPEQGTAQSLSVPGDPAQAVRIGVLLPLSGPRAPTGQALLHAAQLALFDFADPRLVLIPRDTQGTGAGAARAAQAALAAGAELIIGPVFAEEVIAAAAITRAAGRSMIAFSSDSRVAGNGVYLLSFSPEQEAARILSFARAKGLTRIAALVPRTAYGERVGEAYRQSLTTQDGAVPKLVYYVPGSQSLHAPVRQLADYDARRQKLTEEIARLEQNPDSFAQEALAGLKTRDTLGEVDFDALLIADGGASLRALAPLLAYYEIDPKKVRYLGTGLWNEPAIHTETSLTGGWFPAPPKETDGTFRTRMQTLFSITPTPVISLGYDAMALAAVLAAQDTDSGQRFSAQALTGPGGFAGVQGIFRLRPDGLSERGLAIMEIGADGVQVLDPPPASFEPVMN